jgi:hypothetical protein
MFVEGVLELPGLREELDRLLVLDPTAFDEESVTAMVVEGRRQRDRFDAFLASFGAAYLTGRSWEVAGASSAAAHLAGLRGEPQERCGSDLRVARALGRMP